MESVRGRTVKNIIKLLSIWSYSIDLNTSINYTDANIDAENIACGLLNRVFGWKLINLNNVQMNYPGIDLGDFDNKVCVQVTSNRTAKKIKNTVKSFDDNGLVEFFSELYIFCLITDNIQFKSVVNSESIEFSLKENVITLRTLIQKIETLDELIIIDIYQYLDNCFELKNGVNTHDSINIYEFLYEQMDDVQALCLSKMQALGLNRNLAREIWKKGVRDFKTPKFKESITYLVGGFGSGKSHFLYNMYMHLWNAYINNSVKSAIPVFIQGRMLNRECGILSWLEKKVHYTKSMNIFVIVDGLDEMSYHNAEMLIEEIRIIGYKNDNFKAVVASRPLSIIEDEYIYPMPPLTPKEYRALYSLINNGKVINNSLFYQYNADAFKEMISIPLFSILFSLYYKDKGDYISNPMDLVNVFVQQSLKKVLRLKPEVKTQLEKLAVLTINRNLGNINQTEISEEYDGEILLSTGFLLKKQNSYYFTLPIIAQWLGAMAIRDGMESIDDILLDAEMTFAWRYSLSILFSQITFEESEEYFSKILRVAPGMASLVVRDGVCFESIGSLPIKNVSGCRLQKAFAHWMNIIPDINIGFTDTQGKLNTLWYEQGQNRVRFSIAEKYLGKDILYDIKSADRPHFHKYFGRRIYAQATWPWIVSFETISECLSEFLKTRPLILRDSIMELEWIWDSTLKLKGRGSLFSDEIPIKELGFLRDISATNENIFFKNINLKDYFETLQRCNYYQDTIKPPFPVGDIDHYEIGLIWGNYSETRMLERIKYIYEKALDAYPKFIETFFPKLKEQLSTYLMLPVRIEGLLSFDKNGKSYYEAPALSSIAFPIESDKKSIVKFNLGTDNEYHGKEMELIRNADNAFRIFRREHYPYIQVILHSGRCFDASTTPVTDLLYRWLESDLEHIGWIK